MRRWLAAINELSTSERTNALLGQDELSLLRHPQAVLLSAMEQADLVATAEQRRGVERRRRVGCMSGDGRDTIDHPAGLARRLLTGVRASFIRLVHEAESNETESQLQHARRFFGRAPRFPRIN